MEPIDRAALRALATRAAEPTDRTCHTPARLDCSECRHMAQRNTFASRARSDLGDSPTVVLALLDALDAAERVQGEAIAHCRASGEPCWCGAHTSSVGDGEATAPLSAFPGHVECGRALDAAERERDQARADLRTYGEHRDDCHIAIWMRCADEPPAPACTCGYSEALARAEGR